MNKEWLYMAPVLIGVGIIAAYSGCAVFLILDKLITIVGQEKSKRTKTRISKLNPIERLKLKGQLKRQTKQGKEVMMLALGSGFLLALTLPGWFGKLIGFFIGALLAIAGSWIYEVTKQRRCEAQKIKETILLYDTVLIYHSRGYNLYQILEKALPLLNILKPAIEKCLMNYPHGPMEAIAQLEKDLDFDEAGILVSVLLQIKTSGDGAHISGPEAVRLEALRESLFMRNIALRPMYQEYQLYIPLVCGFVMIAWCYYRYIQERFGDFNAVTFIK